MTHRLRPDRARSTARTRPGWRRAPSATATDGGSTAPRCGTPACTSRPTIFVFARTGGKRRRRASGITCFIVPTKSEGFKIEEYLWTFNMPTDHPRVSLTDVCVPADAMLGDPDDGLAVAQHFVHENRIRQAASSLGAAQYCINESGDVRQAAQALRQAARREPGDPVAAGRAAHRGGDAARADPQDRVGDGSDVEARGGARSSRTRSRCATTGRTGWSATRPIARCRCTAAIGYSRHKPFEHIYRHHRRYRITEGAEEIQMRRVAQYLFGFFRDR